MGKHVRFFQNTIAMIYDFDGTLSPQPMQEYTWLPKIRMAPRTFWRQVDQEARNTQSESMLVYMRLLLEKAEAAHTHIGRGDLKNMAKAIRYFPGVEGWFNRINKYVRHESKAKIAIRHYIISAGLKEILEGVSIRRFFQRIYASEYHFNHHDVAVFPKLLITDTTKTQFLFRINKGREEMTESINEHMPESQRPIPFSNIIFIGDGTTDVPSMAVTSANGGHTIAVYGKNSKKGLKVCEQLLQARRAHIIAVADYRANSDLDRRVRLLLKSVISGIEYRRELFECRRKHRI